MGKRLKCLLMAAVFLLSPIRAYASENDFFTITVPNSYEEEQKDNVFLYTKNDEIHNFTIAVSENSSVMDSIKKVTEEDLETYEQSLLDEISDGAGDDVIVLKRGLSTLSDYDAILFHVKRNDLNLYQSMYIFWSDHYLYNVCITADKEDFFYSEEYKKHHELVQNKRFHVQREPFGAFLYHFGDHCGHLCGHCRLSEICLKKR